MICLKAYYVFMAIAFSCSLARWRERVWERVVERGTQVVGDSINPHPPLRGDLSQAWERWRTMPAR